MERDQLVSLIVLVIAVSLVVTYYGFFSGGRNPFIHPVGLPVITPQQSPSPTLTPSPYPYTKTPPTYFADLSQWQVNVTQGESFQIKLNITSFLNETQTFTPEIQLAGYGNAAWDPSKDSQKVYNATFSQQQLVLEPYGNSTTILTISIAQDAPLGRYLFYVVNDGLDVTVDAKTNLLTTQPTAPTVSPTALPKESNSTPTFSAAPSPSIFPTLQPPYPFVQNSSLKIESIIYNTTGSGLLGRLIDSHVSNIIVTNPLPRDQVVSSVMLFCPGENPTAQQYSLTVSVIVPGNSTVDIQKFMSATSGYPGAQYYIVVRTNDGYTAISEPFALLG